MRGVISKKILKVEQQLVAQPNSREAEEAILGCILLKSELFGEVKEFIPKTEVFYYDTSQIVWEKMKELASEHKDIEPISIVSRLNKEEKTKVTGYYLTGLCNDIATTATVINYATIILEKYLQRQLIDATYKIQKSAFENNTEFESLLKFIKKTTDELTSLTPSKDPTLDQIVNQTIESIETSGNYVKFGFKRLDNLAGGMTKGEITVIAGRPSHGKTTFAVNLVKKFIDQGLRVLCINREMTNIEMMKKLIVLESGKLSYSDVRMNNMNDQSYKELVAINEKIVDKYTNRLFMCDTARDLASSTAQIMKHSPDVVIDDYIQLIKWMDMIKGDLN